MKKEFIGGVLMENDKSILMGLPALLGMCVLLTMMSYKSTNIEYKVMYKKFALLFFLAFSAFGCVYISSIDIEDTYKYRAIVDGQIQHFSKCYKIHGHNVCEDGEGDESLVKDYWKTGETNGKN